MEHNAADARGREFHSNGSGSSHAPAGDATDRSPDSRFDVVRVANRLRQPEIHIVRTTTHASGHRSGVRAAPSHWSHSLVDRRRPRVRRYGGKKAGRKKRGEKRGAKKR